MFASVAGLGHGAVDRGNDQHDEGHTFVEPPSWASQGHTSQVACPLPPPIQGVCVCVRCVSVAKTAGSKRRTEEEDGIKS